jgi:hypothetical protein
MLRALDKCGKIELPAKRQKGRVAGQKTHLQLMLHDTSTISCPLSELLPLRVESKIERGGLLGEFKSYIDQYHYLGFGRTVGENMKYMIYSNGGRLLSCLLFGSAAWSCRDRDAYVGWDKTARVKGLQLLSNNTRFWIAQWVNVPHMGSHILSLITRRISSDWEKKYGHRLLCLETFVERDRFKGTVYKASNWIRVGETAGRGRDDVDNTANLPIKDIYLCPLHRKFREILNEGAGV